MRKKFVMSFLSYTSDQLERKLRSMGLSEGDTVFMHSSFSALNGFKNEPQQVVDCLLNIISTSGNLLMVSMPYEGFTSEYLRQKKPFDPVKTPSSMGILTEIFRRQKGVMRSLNPAHPILAFGPRAEWLIADHDKTMYSCGKGSPFEKALKLNAKAFFFDTSFRSMSFCHHLEDHYKENLSGKLYNVEPVEGRVINTDGSETKLMIYVFSDEATKRRSFRVLEREMLKHNLMKVDKIGNTKLILVHLADVADCAQKLVKSGKHLW